MTEEIKSQAIMAWLWTSVSWVTVKTLLPSDERMHLSSQYLLMQQSLGMGNYYSKWIEIFVASEKMPS